MLQRTIHVVSADGSVVKGRVAVSEEERRWEFVPDSPWRSGQFQLVIDTALEDLAGNRIGHPFEADRLDAIEKQIDLEAVRIPFAVSSSAAAER
jgi:ABC-type amino acid transport substrate-binding protein